MEAQQLGALLYYTRLLVARGTVCPSRRSVPKAFMAENVSVLPRGLPVQVQLRGLLCFKLCVWPAVLCCKRHVSFVWFVLSFMWNCLLRFENGSERSGYHKVV